KKQLQAVTHLSFMLQFALIFVVSTRSKTAKTLSAIELVSKWLKTNWLLRLEKSNSIFFTVKEFQKKATCWILRFNKTWLKKAAPGLLIKMSEWGKVATTRFAG